MRKYIATIIIDEDRINISAENYGLTPLEIIAALELKKTDIIKQIDPQASFKRTVIDGDKKTLITEEK